MTSPPRPPPAGAGWGSASAESDEVPLGLSVFCSEGLSASTSACASDLLSGSLGSG